MPDNPTQFKVRQRFAARRVDANLPPDQTVIMAAHDEPETYIDVGELLSIIVEPAREPGAVATFIRRVAEGEYLYRVDAEIFWSSVSPM